jgi:ribonuclease HI
MIVYTDGATSNNGYEGARGGWAYVVLEEDKIIKEESGYVPEATNNRCELIALINACKAICNIWGEHIIYSDSAYCVRCWKEKWYERWERNGWKTSNKTPVANQELWRELIPFFRNSLLKFEKVSGHSGNKWNEYVYKLAVEAKGKING